MSEHRTAETERTNLADWLLSCLTPMICLVDARTGAVVTRTGELNQLVSPGDSLSDMAPPDTVHRLLQLVRKMSEPIFVDDLLFYRAGGGQVRFAGRLRPVSYDGQPCLLMALYRSGADSSRNEITPGVWLDITRQGFWIGDRTRTIFMNRPLRHALGCEPECHLLSCCMLQDRQKLERILEDLLSDDPLLEGRMHTLQFRMQGKPTICNVYPVPAAGTIQRAVQLVFLDTDEFLFSSRFQAYHLELDQMLNRFAFTFIREGWTEPIVQQMMAAVGELMSVSRAFLFRVRPGDGAAEMTHEWRSHRVSSVMASNRFNRDAIEAEWTALVEGHPVVVQTPAEASPRVREVMEKEGTRAFLMAPIIQRDELVGSIGVSETRFERVWAKEERTFLVTLGQLLALARERRDLEGRLRLAYREARESAELKEKFLSTISHEVRNPLNAIIGLSAILERDARPRLTADELKMLVFIRDNGRKLQRTMENVLYLSRLKQAVPVPYPRWFNVRELAGDLSSFMRGRLFGREAELAFELDLSEAPAQMYGDREMVERVFINLLDNAVKFTPSGTVRLAVKVRRSFVLFEVSDTGVGIPEAIQEQIFTEFFQVDDVTTRRFEGVGVGLSIVKALVDAMDGDIEVKSRVGKGTVFSVRFPLEMEET